MFKQKIMLVLVFVAVSFSPMLVNAQLDDPTRPPGYSLYSPNGKKRTVVKRFLLSSVRISTSRRSAIVNDRTVESGDTVDGAKVIAIYPSAVKLKKQGKFFTVRLVSQLTKKIKVR